ncbi:hypothetical protein D3C79_1020140 [compost metagenome]
MTDTSFLIRSPQSLMPFGLPLRTRNTMVEVYGVLASGRRFCQSSGKVLPSLAISSMSPARARVTTSARKPSITARPCLPEPPWDCWIFTLSSG